MSTSRWRRVRSCAAWGPVALACLVVLLGTSAVHWLGPPSWLGLAHEVSVGVRLQVGWVLLVLAAGTALLRVRSASICAVLVAAAVLIPGYGALFAVPDRPPTVGAPLRIAAVNLCADNVDADRMHASLLALDAHVLVLPEFSTFWEARLTERLAGDYPHRWRVDPAPRYGYVLPGLRLAVFSRVPGEAEAERLLLHGVLPQVKVRLSWQGRPFTLFGVHATKPLPVRGYELAIEGHARLADWIGAEPGAVVVAGDFNSVAGGSLPTRLAALGFDNASERARGLAPATWPTTLGLPVAMGIAIDHVMLRGPLVATDFVLGAPNGSDHAPVCATVAWTQHQ